jgi:dephospho-CoA kinase
MRRIAVTGGIAEGKSTVIGYLAAAGYSVASADAIAKEVFVRSEVQQSLRLLLGGAGPVNSDELRIAISKDTGLRRRVNACMHVPILHGLAQSKATFVEIPLLIETCTMGLYDRVWVVTCGAKEQLRRLRQRLLAEEAAAALLVTQLPTAAKSAFADVIIRTNEREESVQRYVLMWAQKELG